MPEGPEIRRAADRVAKAVQGQKLTQVWFEDPKLQESADLLGASTVQKVRTVGKAMLTQFACGLTVYSHNQLYGRWYIAASDKSPKTQRSLRFAIRGEHRSALLYSASDISIWASDAIDQHPFLAKAGIDILDKQPSVDALVAYFQAGNFGRRALGHLLLDQCFVAGVGNYLRSEILYYAGLLPERKLKSLTDKELQALAEATCLLIERAYQTGGVTNDAAKVKELKGKGQTRSQYRHYVFARKGQSCYTCRAKIEQRDVAGRRYYGCPSCQA